MKNKLFVFVTILSLAVGGTLFAFTSGKTISPSRNEVKAVKEVVAKTELKESGCPLEGKPECPKNNCPLKGTPDCPYDKSDIPDCCKEQ